MGGVAQLDMSEVTSFLRVAATIPETSQNDAVLAVSKAMEVWKRQTVGRKTKINTGALAGGFSYNVTRGQKVIKGELTNAMKYAIVIEKGRRPGATPPPWRPIALWLYRKGYVTDRKNLKGIAIYTAKRIGERGFPGLNMVSEGLDASENTIMNLFADVGGDALKRLEKS